MNFLISAGHSGHGTSVTEEREIVTQEGKASPAILIFSDLGLYGPFAMNMTILSNYESQTRLLSLECLRLLQNNKFWTISYTTSHIIWAISYYMAHM